MKRRDFIKKSVSASIALGASLSLGSYTNILASTKSTKSNTNYDLVAVRNGEPGLMFEKGIESFGGIKNFVKSNYKVVIKPNIGWDAAPERAANTNPKLIAKIVKMCKDAGAREVYVFDHTCDDWRRTYKNSGIEKSVTDAGGKMVPANTESYYQAIEIKNGKRLKNDKIHELMLESDLVINVPVLKSHGSAKMTGAMKNLMGVNWDRGYWHRNDLHQCIADFSTACKPHLNVIDAYHMMFRNGPRGVSFNDVVVKKSLIISGDIVAADAAAAKIFGVDPADIPYIKIAHDMKIGSMDLESMRINRIVL
jgi:uncharacterized protein (DUF362 family)